jgi:BirA family biotin operon repressor/biotin-[acetyl-CoA-carboxylase] ligase
MSNIDAAAILDALNPGIASRMAELEVFPEIESTNAYLMAQSAPDAGMHRVAIAGHQTAGRGRGEKRWLSAPGSSLCLSIAHTFGERPENLAALTLAIGVAAARALEDSGIEDVKLKWPNDIVSGDGKLGGILVETHHGSQRTASVVVGIGINLDLPAEILDSVDSTWANAPTDLRSVLGQSVARESLTAAMIGHIADAFSTFERQGFDAFAESWSERDWLRGRNITVQRHGRLVKGKAFGIDTDGALIVQGVATATRVISGSVLVDGVGSTSS